jgi:hypothetical protein
MKAINTLYAGNYFRSRTEARWAVYFDLIGVKWEYEKDGYDLGDGVKYLPDFWFPKHKMYGEVKATNDLTDVEVDKAKRLALQSKREVVILSGPPHCKTCTVFNKHGESFGVPFADELCGKYGSVYYGDLDFNPNEIGPVAAIEASMARFEHGADNGKRSRLRILNNEEERQIRSDIAYLIGVLNDKHQLHEVDQTWVDSAFRHLSEMTLNGIKLLRQ